MRPETRILFSLEGGTLWPSAGAPQGCSPTSAYPTGHQGSSPALFSWLAPLPGQRHPGGVAGQFSRGCQSQREGCRPGRAHLCASDGRWYASVEEGLDVSGRHNFFRGSGRLRTLAERRQPPRTNDPLTSLLHGVRVQRAAQNSTFKSRRSSRRATEARSSNRKKDSIIQKGPS
jgi:hypothetical protein